MLYARHNQYHPKKMKINLLRSVNLNQDQYQMNAEGVGNRSQNRRDPSYSPLPQDKQL